MQTGFKIHKQAVLLEYNLNQFIAQAKKEKHPYLADISMLYDRPVHIVREILLQVKAEETLSERDEWIIQMIQERYQPYESFLLKQLDETICLSMCKDLETLNQGMQCRYKN